MGYVTNRGSSSRATDGLKPLCKYSATNFLAVTENCAYLGTPPFVFSSRILPFSQSRSHGRILRNSVLRIEPVRNIARIALLRGHVAELQRFGRSAHSISTTSSGVRTWSYSFVRSRETFRLSGAIIWKFGISKSFSIAARYSQKNRICCMYRLIVVMLHPLSADR